MLPGIFAEIGDGVKQRRKPLAELLPFTNGITHGDFAFVKGFS